MGLFVLRFHSRGSTWTDCGLKAFVILFDAEQ